MNEQKILFYDLETSPLQAWIWRLGKQVVRHDQLVEGHSRYGIICATYCFNDGKPAKSFDWGYEEQDSARTVRQFDAMVRKEQPDIIIGKNSDRFDNKQINTIRMWDDLEPFPDMMDMTDDLEKQMRKYFYFPSNTLDYFSAQMGLGGKIKMRFQDWIDIVTKNENGQSSLKKMIKYGKKDITDTRALWDQVSRHCKPKYNAATNQGGTACTNCGSTDIRRNGTRPKGKTIYQRFYCLSHGGHAGYAPISATGKEGKMGA